MVLLSDSHIKLAGVWTAGPSDKGDVRGEGSHGQTAARSQICSEQTLLLLGAQFPCWSKAAFLWGHLECKQQEGVMGTMLRM